MANIIYRCEISIHRVKRITYNENDFSKRKAILVDFGNGIITWLPCSQIGIDEDKEASAFIWTLYIPAWIVKDKDLWDVVEEE